MRRRTFLALAVGGLAMGGCARHHGYETVGDVFGDSSFKGPYQLATGDRLRVIVFGQDNLSNVYAVDSQGRISMPLIGAVDATGRTTQQLERAIEGRLRGGFLREPKVSVEVDAYRPFFILGEVTASGQYPFVNGMTIQTAIAIAGGFTPRADRHVAVISRHVNGEFVTAKAPITQPVMPGDTITIRERWF
jgi:polysaccharide export outer membrane protein